MKKEWGSTVARIVRLLNEEGAMSRAEICQRLGLDRTEVSAIVTRMAKPSATMPKRVYVKAYVYDCEGARRYPRAVYELGDKPDAKRPKADPKGAKERYRKRQKMLLTANSVFNLGLTRRQLKAQRGSLAIRQ